MRVARLSLAATLLLSGHASAQGTEVATARQLAIQGIDAVEGGDCDGGSALLERAEQLHHATVHLQYLARCHVRAGRLVSATEAWRRIVREGAPPTASPAVKNAIAEASTELERTLPRLGTATLRTAASYPGLELTLDGKPLSAALIDTPQVIDPGRHQLTARAPGFLPWTKDWTVTEGATVEVQVELSDAPSGQGSAGTSSGSPGDELGKDGPTWVTPAGYVAGAAGAAALVAGTVTFLMRNNKRSTLEENCPAKVCPRDEYPGDELEGDKNEIETLTLASNLLLFGGGALLLGGVTLVVVGKSSGPDRSALVTGTPLSEVAVSMQGRF